ncbi:hypothetical protein RF55_17881 [Lasius niger]|uniref:Uncharacterized protein n=1 Tax=Lasius niger TaxID=67767 RepID=A0A0J7K247_LASNI|nr:hypothetical protein RF55_17881 [Lasius niger]
MDVLKAQTPAICKQCEKEIKTETWRCVPCDRLFHPSCHKLHKVYNSGNELIPCKGKTEIVAVKGTSTTEVCLTSERGRERKLSGKSKEVECQLDTLDGKIDASYKIIKEIKDDIIGKSLIKNTTWEAIKEEMHRVMDEIQIWKETKLKSLVEKAVRNEIQKVTNILPPTSSCNMDAGKMKSYSEAASNGREAVIIIRPKEEDASSSEITKRDIKNKIDVSKMGVGITKMKKVTKGAIVVGCENKTQVERLKDKVLKDLGETYVIQAPTKKKLKIKIFGVSKEDTVIEQEFWKKIEEQNGFRKDSIKGRIVHILSITGFQRAAITAEVNAETHKQILIAQKK